MSDFGVDTEMLAELVQRMSACHARFEQVDDEVDARMKRLHASWQGAAAGLHAAAHRRWITGSRQMAEALTVLRGIAKIAGQNYSAAALANQRMWSQ